MHSVLMLEHDIRMAGFKESLKHRLRSFDYASINGT